VIGAPLLIIGARPGSLGEAVAQAMPSEVRVITAGITVYEDMQMNVLEPLSITEVLENADPHSILVTTGINIGEPVGQKGFPAALRRSMDVNFIGIMSVLHQWVYENGKNFYSPQQFVAVSSNSAHIARRNSAAYCASKAALSMGIRCAARELAGRPLVYGYELGLLKGTPMTAATEERFGPSQSRMVGAESGLDKTEVAGIIAHNLMNPTMALNGTMLRLDAGEQ
jgi:NAD(P)-dependent dehydrogenase (short-subunit alcohol dehydrogenase family)